MRAALCSQLTEEAMIHICVASVFFGKKLEDKKKFVSVCIFYKHKVLSIDIFKPTDQSKRVWLEVRFENSSYGGTD